MFYNLILSLTASILADLFYYIYLCIFKQTCSFIGSIAFLVSLL